MRRSKTISIIIPLNRTVRTIDNHKIFKFNSKENILIISIGGNLCKVLANQNIKLGNL